MCYSASLSPMHELCSFDPLPQTGHVSVPCKHLTLLCILHSFVHKRSSCFTHARRMVQFVSFKLPAVAVALTAGIFQMHNTSSGRYLV